MKTSRISLMAALIAGVLLAYSPALRAQDAKEGKSPRTREGRPGRGGPGGQEYFNKLAEDLKLTAEQKPKVEAVLKEQREKMRGLRDLSQDERREKFKAIHEETAKKLKDILTAEQFAKWEKMRAQRPGGPARGERKGADKK
jgi:protein CpxP